MEIVKHTQNPIILAMGTPSLKEGNVLSNKKFLYEKLALAAEYGGLKIAETQSLKFIAENLHLELLKSFPYIRLGEIEIAFKKGIMKEYGEFFGLNVATAYNFVKSYLKSEEKKKALEEVEKLREITDKPVRTPEEIFNLNKEALIKSFNNYKQNKELPFGAHVTYNFLKKYKGVDKLITDKETQDKIKKEALLIYQGKLREKKKDRGISTTDFNILMNEINNSSYLKEVGRLCLKYYFDKLIEENKEI